MKQLDATTTVACPAEFVSAFVEAKLRRSEGADRKLHLRLQMPAASVGTKNFVDFERAVVAQLRRISPLDLDLSWDAEPAGPFPHFSGHLSTVETAPGRCILHLSGSYEPPLGALGSVFDSAVGARVAHSTATDLVERLRDEAEADYRVRTAP